MISLEDDNLEKGCGVCLLNLLGPTLTSAPLLPLNKLGQQPALRSDSKLSIGLISSDCLEINHDLITVNYPVFSGSTVPTIRNGTDKYV